MRRLLKLDITTFIPTIRRAAKLLQNGLRFRLLRYRGKPHRLESISLEITHRCICRCHMCNIWKIPADVPDMDLAGWLRILASPELKNLKELDLTGGEPFLRPDLGELIQQIAAMQSTHFPGLRTLSITTNGLLTDRVLDLVHESIAILKDRNIDLVLACGMDAVGELHDNIRNTPGAWSRLQKTLTGLKELATHHSNLILGIKTTIVPLNVRELDRISAFAQEYKLFTIISPCIITPNRFGNLDREEDLKFSPEDLEKLIAFYSSPRFAWSGHREALLGYLKTGSMRKPCSAGYNTLFVRHTGEVFGCAVLQESLGNVQQQSLSTIFRGPAADRFRQRVSSFPECSQCTEPGLERVAWPLEGFSLLKVLIQKGKADFNQLIRHMGLDKYL